MPDVTIGLVDEAGVYEEVQLSEMDWVEEDGMWYYPCPCGDVFELSKEAFDAGERIARCPSCSLKVKVLTEAAAPAPESSNKAEATEQPPENEPVDIRSLHEDLLLQIFGCARLDALLALRCASRDFATLARQTLKTSPRWEQPRKLMRKENFNGKKEALSAVRADDYELIEALILSRAFKINSTVYEAGLPTPEEAIWHPAHALMTPEQIWHPSHPLIQIYAEQAIAANPPPKSTLLHCAHTAQMVHLLVGLGADVDVRNAEGRTPLMDACAVGLVEVVRALCECGASVDLRDVEQRPMYAKTAAQYASECDVRRAQPQWRASSDTPRHMERDGNACVAVLMEHGAGVAGLFTHDELDQSFGMPETPR